MIRRSIEPKIIADFKRKKVIVILGARQVGKTTLFDSIAQGKQKILTLNCDNFDDAQALEEKTSTELANMLSAYE